MAFVAFDAAILTAHNDPAGQHAVVGSTTARDRLRNVAALFTLEQVDFMVRNRSAGRRRSSDPSPRIRTHQHFESNNVLLYTRGNRKSSFTWQKESKSLYSTSTHEVVGR